MATVTKTVEVPKEIDEVMEALADVVVAVKDALKDGFQIGTDLPAIVLTAAAKLPAAVEGIDQVDDEFKNDLVGSLQAVALGSGKIAGALLAKDDPA